MIRLTLGVVINRYDLVLHEDELTSPLSFEIRRHVLDRCRIILQKLVLWSDIFLLFAEQLQIENSMIGA